MTGGNRNGGEDTNHHRGSTNSTSTSSSNSSNNKTDTYSESNPHEGKVEQTCIGHWIRRPTQENARGACLGLLFVKAFRHVHASDYSSGTLTLVLQSVTKEQQQRVRDLEAATQREKNEAQQTQVDMEKIRQRWREVNAEQSRQKTGDGDADGFDPNVPSPSHQHANNSSRNTRFGNDKQGSDESFLDKSISKTLQTADTVADLFQPNSESRQAAWKRIEKETERQKRSMSKAIDTLVSRRTVDEAVNIVGAAGKNVQRAWKWIFGSTS